MKNSPFQIVLIGVLSLCALIGLFLFANHTGNTSKNAGPIGTVVIWGTLPRADMEPLLAQISQANASFQDVSYVQKDESTIVTDLSAAIATQNSPDLVLTSQEELQQLIKFITPIQTTTLPASTFTNSFIREGNILAIPDGSGYYGLPFLVDPLVLFSNRSILSTDGIAHPPATWESLIGLVPHVAQFTQNRQVTRGLIALGTYDNVHNGRAILSTLFQQTGIPISSYTKGNLSASFGGPDAPGGASAGNAVLGFYTQFADPSKVSYTWNASLPDSKQAFLVGNLGLYVGFASEAKFLATANPNLDFIVSEIPQPATAKLKSTYGLVYSFMIPRGSKNPSGAYQAAAFFTTPDVQSAAANATGLAPALLNQLATQPSSPVASVAYAEALYANGWLSPSPADTDKVFSGMITSVVSGRSNLDTALAWGSGLLSTLLQK